MAVLLTSPRCFWQASSSCRLCRCIAPCFCSHCKCPEGCRSCSPSCCGSGSGSGCCGSSSAESRWGCWLGTPLRCCPRGVCRCWLRKSEPLSPDELIGFDLGGVLCLLLAALLPLLLLPPLLPLCATIATRTAQESCDSSASRRALCSVRNVCVCVHTCMCSVCCVYVDGCLVFCV